MRRQDQIKATRKELEEYMSELYLEQLDLDYDSDTYDKDMADLYDKRVHAYEILEGKLKDEIHDLKQAFRVYKEIIG